MGRVPLAFRPSTTGRRRADHASGVRVRHSLRVDGPSGLPARCVSDRRASSAPRSATCESMACGSSSIASTLSRPPIGAGAGDTGLAGVDRLLARHQCGRGGDFDQIGITVGGGGFHSRASALAGQDGLNACDRVHAAMIFRRLRVRRSSADCAGQRSIAMRGDGGGVQAPIRPRRGTAVHDPPLRSIFAPRHLLQYSLQSERSVNDDFRGEPGPANRSTVDPGRKDLRRRHHPVMRLADQFGWPPAAARRC